MRDVIIEAENEIADVYDGFMANDLQTAVDAGVEVIKFSPEDLEWYLNTGYDGGWGKIFERYPELGPKFKELLTK